MATKKPQPQPIFPIKHDFYLSLDNFIQQASMLHIAVDTALEVGGDKIPPPLADRLRKASDDFKKAWGGIC